MISSACIRSCSNATGAVQLAAAPGPLEVNTDPVVPTSPAEPTPKVPLTVVAPAASGPYPYPAIAVDKLPTVMVPGTVTVPSLAIRILLVPCVNACSNRCVPSLSCPSASALSVLLRTWRQPALSRSAVCSFAAAAACFWII